MGKPKAPKISYNVTNNIKVKTKVTKYRRSFLLGICEGRATVKRIWKAKKLIYDFDDIELADLGSITLFEGDGINAGLKDLVTGVNAADTYSDHR